MFSYILFDLDGTVSDPKAGITGCVQYALKSFGIEEPDRDRLEPFIGPPLRDSFMKYYGFTAEQAQLAVDKYRERFSVTGKYENELYPGMDYLLSDLKASGAHHIGVTYGYAGPGELEAAGAEIIVRNVEGLRQVLLGFSDGENRQPYADGTEQRSVHDGAGPGSAYGDPAWGGTGPGGAYGGPAHGGADQGGGPARGAFSGAVQGGPGGSYGGNPPGRRPARTDSRGMRILKAVGICLLAMGLYYIVNLAVGGIIIMVGMMLSAMRGAAMSVSYNFWLNVGNAAGTIGGFAVCYAIWHKQMRIRPRTKPDRLSLIPMAVSAAAVAMGMNGFLTLVELYKYSPTFQQISELQFDTPVWLGILSFGILAPLAEEVIFRGVIYNQLKKALNVPAAIALSGLAFGLFHGNLVQAVYATVIGILLAIVYEIYDSILAPMVFHAIANLFVYFLLDLSGFGGVFLMPVSCLFFLVVAAVSTALMVKWQNKA